MTNPVVSAFNGPFLNDPGLLLGSSVTAANLASPQLTYATTDANFWTGANESIDRYGMQDDSNNGTSFKTLLDLTATKTIFFAGVIGPTLATAGDTWTVRITKDGRQFADRVLTSQQNTSRPVLGNVVDNREFSTAGWYINLNSSGAPSDGVTSDASSNGVHVTWLPVGALMVIAPSALALCTRSLKIETKVSVAVNGTANQERRQAVLYRRTL